MVIRRFTPAPCLQKLIKCYYYLEKHDDQTIYDSYFADGCIEAVFSTGWEFYKDGTKEDWAKVIGQILRPRALKIAGRGKSFGIWFYPHAFSYFSGLNVAEINDRVLSWDSLFPRDFSEFTGNCLIADKLHELVSGMDEFWIRRLSAHRESRADKLIEVATGYIYARKGAGDLNDLASRLNVSQRYLQKLFVSRIGVSQKHFMKIIRFQEVMKQLPGYSSSLTDLTYEHGYYDQSHFIREFKSFTGVCPSRFDTARFPINQHFISAD